MPISSIDRAQEEIVELLEAGKSISDVVNHWIQTDPQVIALLLLEHRIQHIVFAEYLLTIVDYLEAIVPPEELYSALGKQMKLNQEPFMEWVLERHPSALWLVGLFRELEGSRMGYYHLLHKHRHADRARSRDIPLWCLRYAQQGAKDGLIAFAKETGNPIPAAVLYGVGDSESGLEAAIGAFKRNSKSPVLEFLAAKVGPDLDAIILQIDERLDEANIDRPAMIEWWLSI